MNIDKKYYQEINDNLTNTIQDTNIDAPNKKVGKVRDAYFLDDKVVMISTDRQSAFDRVLAAIPYKGAVLNSVSAWWFKKTEHLFPNHLISTPDPNVSIGKNCIIGAKALITENKIIPDNSLVVGSPGKVIREVSEEEKKAVFENTKHYQDNWKKYSKSIF